MTKLCCCVFYGLSSTDFWLQYYSSETVLQYYTLDSVLQYYSLDCYPYLVFDSCDQCAPMIFFSSQDTRTGMKDNQICRPLMVKKSASLSATRIVSIINGTTIDALTEFPIFAN